VTEDVEEAVAEIVPEVGDALVRSPTKGTGVAAILDKDGRRVVWPQHMVHRGVDRAVQSNW
jgi:hypothetical protein